MGDNYFQSVGVDGQVFYEHERPPAANKTVGLF